MYIRTALAASTLALILMVMPLSADESDALYKGKVVISNAGTEVEGGTTVLLELNTGAWQGAGILDASFNNAWFESAAGASMAFMPDPSDAVTPQEWYFFHPWDLAAGDSLAYLYMGGPDMSPPIRYIPGAAGMTTPDAPSMELGTNFAVELRGYFDTSGNDSYLLLKDSALHIMIDEGTIRAGNPTRIVPSPTSASGFTNSANVYDNNTGSYAYQASVPATTWSNYLVVTFPSSNVAGAQVFAWGLGGAYFTQIEAEAYYGGSWNAVSTYSMNNNAWTYEYFDALADVSSLRFRFYNNTASPREIRVGEVKYATGGYVSPNVVAAVSSGSHTVRVEADGSDLSLFVDSVLQDTEALGGWSVPDNGNVWIVASGGSMPCMEYSKLWVGGALKQHIVWEDDTTFTDLSGNGNDATPSFPTGSSDADVSAVLASMEVIDPAAAPAGGGDESGGLAGGLPDEPDNMYDELSVDHLPGAEVVNALLDAGDIPQALFWFLFVFLGIIIACLFMYRLSHSLFAMSLVAGAGLLFASRIGIVPFWVTVPVILVAAAVLIKEKMSPL